MSVAFGMLGKAYFFGPCSLRDLLLRDPNDLLDVRPALAVTLICCLFHLALGLLVLPFEHVIVAKIFAPVVPLGIAIMKGVKKLYGPCNSESSVELELA